MGIKILKPKRFEKGFTFLEFVIVIGVIAVVLPVVFSMFFLTLRGQARIYSLQEVKKNGDYALTIIENLLRNDAKTIVSDYQDPNSTILCATTGQDLGGVLNVRTKNSDGFQLSVENNKIASKSASTSQTSYLTSDKVVINGVSIRCDNNNQYANPLVSISFTVSKTGARAEDTASINYETKIKLRN
jgi:Tfp pilus assembly protein FimT